MNKKFPRRLLVLLIAFSMIVMPGVNAFGQTVLNNADEKININDGVIAEGCEVQISEYDAIEELAIKPDKVLVKEGYDEDEIAKIKNYKDYYSDFVYELSELDDEALAAAGYTGAQIEIIKNFNGDQKDIERVSATLNISANPQYFRYEASEGLTKGMLSYSWSWSGIPAFKMTDLVAVGWNGWTLFSTSDKQSSTIKYYNVNNGNLHSTSSGTMLNVNDGASSSGRGHKFAVAKNDNAVYAKSGTGYFKVKSDVYAKKNFYCQAKYGHSQLSLTPTFSVSLSGISVSVSFGKKITTAGTSNVNYEF